MRKTASSIKENKTNSQKLGYPLPAPPFPVEIQRRKKTLSKKHCLDSGTKAGKKSTATVAFKSDSVHLALVHSPKRVKEQAANIKAGPSVTVKSIIKKEKKKKKPYAAFTHCPHPLGTPWPQHPGGCPASPCSRGEAAAQRPVRAWSAGRITVTAGDP